MTDNAPGVNYHSMDLGLRIVFSLSVFWIIAPLASHSLMNGDGGGEIEVFSPIPGETVSAVFEVSGEGRAFENLINNRVRDGNREEIERGKTYTNAKSPSDKGRFNLTVHLEGGIEGGDITLEVFSIATRDGKEINIVTIPLKYSGEEKREE